MTMWNDYEKIARRLDRIANAFERIANALETANIIEADRKTEPTISKMEQVDEPQIETKTETKNSNLTFDTPQTEETCERCVYVRGSQWCQGCNGTPKRWDGEKIADTPQTEDYDFRDEQEYNDRWQTDCGWGEPITVSHSEERED